jgi:hypothetical protein
MIDGARLYYQAIDDLMDEFSERSPYAELEVFMTSTFDEEFGGTMDCVIRGDRLCIVVDYKYGYNPVEVAGNTQILSYLGVAANTGDDMIGVIVQPRWNHPDGRIRSIEVSDRQIEEWLERVESTIRAHRAGEITVNVGSHCKYCNHMANCKELKDLVMSTVEKDPNDLSPGELAEALKAEKIFKTFFQKVSSRALDILDDGSNNTGVPGYKVVETYGRRKWKDKDAVVNLMEENDIEPDDYLTGPELKSPAQLEKVVGKALLEGLHVVETTGTTVAPDSDRRPGVDYHSVRKEFS